MVVIAIFSPSVGHYIVSPRRSFPSKTLENFICIFIGFVCDFINFLCEFTVKTTEHTVARYERAVISHENFYLCAQEKNNQNSSIHDMCLRFFIF
jgi:hypothetical protein